MMGGQTPVIILREGTSRNRGKGAQSNNIAAAKAIADAVRTTLGPKGMDKMLVDSMGDIVITNDGATIMKEIDIEHPAAKMVVEAAKTQDDECGDGTTTAVVVAGELLRRSEDLVEQNVHATVIANGYRLAANKAIELLTGMGFVVKMSDKATLKKLANTAMTGKAIGSKEHLSSLVVDAVLRIIEDRDKRLIADISKIKVEKKHGGSVGDTQLIDGILLDKERVHTRMPSFVKNTKIALLDTAIEIKKTEVDAKIQITDPSKLQAFLDAEENTLKSMVASIKKSGANVVICQKGIDDLAQHFLVKEGIFAIRRVKKSDMAKLALATGAKVVTNLDDLTASDLGKAKLVEERKVGDDDMTFVTGCVSPKAVSLLIRGGTEHGVDEIERAMHDALKVVAVAIEDGVALPGGGAPEIEMALRLREYASSIGGREQLAVEAFADGLEIIPRTLAENAGLDPINTLVALRTAHGGKKQRNHGVDAYSGKVKDMLKEHVIEPLRVKRQAIESATEVAIMILRIDDVIASKKGGAPAGPPGGMDGMGGMPGMM